MNTLQSNDVQDVLNELAELIAYAGEGATSIDISILLDFLDNQNAIYAPACGECAA